MEVGGLRADDDERAFAEMYRVHAGHITAYALRRCHRDDVADVVSETFVVAWRRFDDVPSEPMTRAWLYGVARRVAANQRRGARRRTELVDKVSTQMLTALPTTPDPEGWRSQTGAVTDALGTLSEWDREVLFLTAWEELTPTEIGQVLDLPADVVRKRLFRARRRLEQAIEAASTDAAEPTATDTAEPATGLLRLVPRGGAR